VFNLLAMAFIGLTFGPLNIYENVWVAIIGPTLWLIGNIFLLQGYTATIKATKI